MKKIAILTWWPGLEKEVAKRSATFFEKNLDREYDIYILPEKLNIFLENKDIYSLVIPIFHGEYGEDGKIFAFLDVLWIPTIGSNYYTHAICLNKNHSNILAKKWWLNIPDEYFPKHEHDFPKKYPVIMKPNRWWSSLYTYKIENDEDFSEKYDWRKLFQ